MEELGNLLQAGPYYAVPLAISVAKAFGGADVDLQGRVLDTEGRAIPRLYVAGELGGIWGFVYLSGGSPGHLLESLEGKRGIVRAKPPLPAITKLIHWGMDHLPPHLGLRGLSRDSRRLTLQVVGSGPDAFAQFIQAEVSKWGKIVKESGAKVD